VGERWEEERGEDELMEKVALPLMVGEPIKTMAGAFLAEPLWKVLQTATAVKVFGNNDAVGETSSCDTTCDGFLRWRTPRQRPYSSPKFEFVDFELTLK